MATVSDMLSELDDHGFEDTGQTRKVSILNDVANDVNSRNPWKFLRAETTLTLTAGDDSPTMPADYRQALGITLPDVQVTLIPDDVRAIRKTYRGDTVPAQPFMYYFVGETLRVYPVPDQTYNAVLDYVRNQPLLTGSSVEADILLPPRHHRVLVLGALSRLYAMEDDTELSSLFGNQFEARILTMTEDLTAEQYDRPMRVIDVYDEYDWWA